LQEIYEKEWDEKLERTISLKEPSPTTIMRFKIEVV
jgi:hypothetical protein